MKLILSSALAVATAAMMLVGCAGDTTNPAPVPASDMVMAAAPTATVSSSTSQNAGTSSSAVTTPAQSSSDVSELEEGSVEKVLADLVEGQYPELAMTATVKDDEVKPGEAVVVEVTVSNEGDETLVYTRGSHILENPDALLMQVEGLQPVMSKDQLEAMEDAATRNDATRELTPGDEETFEMHVMAIMPDEDFEERTHTAFASDNDYLADLEWDELQERYPELSKAAVGSYTGNAYFTYYVLGEEEDSSVTRTPTGYELASFVIVVAE